MKQVPNTLDEIPQKVRDSKSVEPGLSKRFRSVHDLQQEILQVKLDNFSDFPRAIDSAQARAFNISEEAGELAREERLNLDGMGFNEAKAVDAVGDLFIATIGYCIARGWSAQLIIEKTWNELRQRWESGKLVGKPIDSLRQ